MNTYRVVPVTGKTEFAPAHLNNCKLVTDDTVKVFGLYDTLVIRTGQPFAVSNYNTDMKNH